MKYWKCASVGLLLVCLMAWAGLGYLGEENKALEVKVINLEEKVSIQEGELLIFQEKCPPREFGSVTELETWVSLHIQPSTLFIERVYRSALKIQDAGLEDGYLINVSVSPACREGFFVVYCSALVNGQLYTWSPEEDFFDGVYKVESFGR